MVKKSIRVEKIQNFCHICHACNIHKQTKTTSIDQSLLHMIVYIAAPQPIGLDCFLS